MSFPIAGSYPTWFRPRKTIAFGTVITSIVNPHNKKRTKVTNLKYTDGGTAHTLTLLRPLGSMQLAPLGAATGPTPGGSRSCNAYVTTAVAASGTTVILSRDPGAYAANFLADGFGTPLVADNLLAANDLVLIELAQPNKFGLATVSAVTVNTDGTATCTVGAAPTGGYPKNARVFFLGITTDSDPRTGEAHPAYASGTSSAAITVGGIGESICETIGLAEPILFYSNNATATGILEALNGVYADN